MNTINPKDHFCQDNGKGICIVCSEPMPEEPADHFHQDNGKGICTICSTPMPK